MAIMNKTYSQLFDVRNLSEVPSIFTKFWPVFTSNGYFSYNAATLLLKGLSNIVDVLFGLNLRYSGELQLTPCRSLNYLCDFQVKVFHIFKIGIYYSRLLYVKKRKKNCSYVSRLFQVSVLIMCMQKVLLRRAILGGKENFVKCAMDLQTEGCS